MSKLHHINPQRLEKLLYRIFAAIRLDIEINDRFGHSVRPQEWFQVPLALIEEAVAHIQDGSITHLRYDPQTARFVETPEA